MIVFTLNVCILKNGMEKIKEKCKRRRYLWMYLKPSLHFYMWISQTNQFSLPGIRVPHRRQYKSNEFLAVFSAGLPKFMSALNYERCFILWKLIKHAKKLYNIMPDILGLWAIWPYVVSLGSCLQWIFSRFYPVNNSTFREMVCWYKKPAFSLLLENKE